MISSDLTSLKFRAWSCQNSSNFSTDIMSKGEREKGLLYLYTLRPFSPSPLDVKPVFYMSNKEYSKR